MAETTPLSYQTTMPEYPDVSYEAYKDYYFGPGGRKMPYAPLPALSGKADYSTWQSDQLNRYNAQLSSYNTWLQSGAGIRASALSGDYNPSYFSNGSSSASPVNFQQASGPDTMSPFTMMATGVDGILSIIGAVQNFQLMREQIAGQRLKNDKQDIENKFLAKILQNRANLLGYQAGAYKFGNEVNLGKRFGVPQVDPSTGLLDGMIMNYGGMDYNLMNADKAFDYQQAAQDINYRAASSRLQSLSGNLAKLNAKEKEFYNKFCLPIVEKQMKADLRLTREKTSLTFANRRKVNRETKWMDQLKQIELEGKRFGLKDKQIRLVTHVVKEARDTFSFFMEQ